jgi:toxin ParE1/3/4
MARVVVADAAHADFDELIAYLVQESGIAVGARYASGFDALYDRLVEFPEIGPARSEFGPHARIAMVHPFVVVYDYADDTVTILRILHGKRNITADLIKR